MPHDQGPYKTRQKPFHMSLFFFANVFQCYIFKFSPVRQEDTFIGVDPGLPILDAEEFISSPDLNL